MTLKSLTRAAFATVIVLVSVAMAPPALRSAASGNMQRSLYRRGSLPRSDVCGPWGKTYAATQARYGEIRYCLKFDQVWVMTTLGGFGKRAAIAVYLCHPASQACLDGRTPHPLSGWRFFAAPASIPGPLAYLEQNGQPPVNITSGNPSVGFNVDTLQFFPVPATPRLALQSYYLYINADRYRLAYNTLAPVERPPYGSWQAGYRSTRRVTLDRVIAAPYLVRARAFTYTCVALRISALQAGGHIVAYGGWYLVRSSHSAGWYMVLPGSRIALNGPARLPGREVCARSIPPAEG